MIFSKKIHDGELFVDHRNSPGLTAEQAIKLGYPPELVGEGKQMYAPTLGCKHCGGAAYLNPMRTRERAWCSICDVYICDGCDYLRKQPGYIHHTFAEIAELVRSGRF